MPRILRNYLISFVIIGGILLIIHMVDLYFNPQSDSPSPTHQQTSTNGSEESQTKE